MADNTLTEIVFLIDKSGSMAKVANETRCSFNQYISNQKNETDRNNKANLTLYSFSDELETIYEDIPLDSVPILDENNYKPDGGTALLDSIAGAITKVKERHASVGEDVKPAKVLFVIQTDGEELSSRKYRGRFDLITDMICERKKNNWEFIFLGADQDTIGGAAKLQIANNIDYKNTALGNSQAYDTLTSHTRMYRTTGKVN